MTTARCILVPEGVSRCYHVTSRCVRRAFLCSDEHEHRREWIRTRLLDLDRIFAIEIGGYAIMGNHLHLLVRTQPQWVDQWSDREVARRWLMLYPKLTSRLRGETNAADLEAAIQRLASDPQRIRSCRRRLASLSWFMKCLKEPIARRANREDDVTGHFWEGRFKVQSLLDEAAVLACMVYIDLNPIRAGVASTPESSDYTSVQDRIRGRQRQMLRCQGTRVAGRARSRGTRRSSLNPPVLGEEGVWLIPIRHRSGRQASPPRDGLFDMTLDEYLELVDMTGRHVRPDKRGFISPNIPAILSRLGLDAERWIDRMLAGVGIGTAIGDTASLAAEAARRGVRRVVNALQIYGTQPTGG